MYPTIKKHPCQTLSQNLHTISGIQRSADAPSPTVKHQETQPFLPAIQRSTDGSSPTVRHQETQPFLPVVQRSADDPSNSRESTQSSDFDQMSLSTNHVTPPPQPHTGTEQPGRRVLVGYDSAGGELILGWRKSALLQKFSLFERRQTRVREILKRF